MVGRKPSLDSAQNQRLLQSSGQWPTPSFLGETAPLQIANLPQRAQPKDHERKRCDGLGQLLDQI